MMQGLVQRIIKQSKPHRGQKESHSYDRFQGICALVPLMPRILAGKPLLPAKRTMRLMVTHDLPAGEQQYLEHTLKHDSGKAYRAMICGLARAPMNSVRCPALCLSGREDRIVSRRIAAAIAARYNAPHYEFPDRGHWLVAPSNLDVAATAALQWIESAVAI
jgi:pimeloyl-ACP methyl ester carboxylesterase